jgi:tetratricopeptide (TPR) repeat protein
MALGVRSGSAEGIKHLQDAVAASRQALQVHTRDHFPQDWARTQSNLGVALRVLGERSGGAEGIKHLQDAVAASRQALQVRTRDHSPQQWAMTQSNLGDALWALGKRSGGAEGAKHLENAMAAYRAALTVFTREHLPQYWARTQGSLGNALVTLGERSGDETRRKHFAEAVECYSRTLTIFSRESAPQDWQDVTQKLHRVEVDLYLEGGEWEKAAEAGRKLAELDRHPASQARSVTAGLGTGDSEGSLRRADALLATRAVRQDPDAVAELQVARIVCLAALGQKPKAAEAAAALAEHIGKQPPSYRPTGPWLGLRNYIEKSGDRNITARRKWLLGYLDAIQKESRDDVLKALRDLPELK